MENQDQFSLHAQSKATNNSNNDNDNNTAELQDEEDLHINELEEELGEDQQQRILNHKVSFPIKDGMATKVKEKAKEHNYPMMEEYDFRHDPRNRSFAIHLSSTTHLRPYQERCLNKMFGNSRARSGLIVLPCGAVRRYLFILYSLLIILMEFHNS